MALYGLEVEQFTVYTTVNMALSHVEDSCWISYKQNIRLNLLRKKNNTPKLIGSIFKLTYNNTITFKNHQTEHHLPKFTISNAFG